MGQVLESSGAQVYIAEFYRFCWWRCICGLEFHFVILFHSKKSHTPCKTETLTRILWCLPASIFTQQSQHEMKDSVAKGNVEHLQKFTAGDGTTSAVQSLPMSAASFFSNKGDVKLDSV